MKIVDNVPRLSFPGLTRTAVVLAVTLVCWQSAHAAVLTAGDAVVNPNTGQYMLVYGYDDGTLEFRDWQGTLIAGRPGFGEIAAVRSWRRSDSALPRLFVGSTDSGGTLRVIDPANISSDLASRSGFGRITVLWPYGDDDYIYVGSTDSGGALRKLNSLTLADQAARFGFIKITFVEMGWDATWDNYFLVGSTDSTGALRCVSYDTLADHGPSPRFGFGTIYSFWTDDMDEDNNAELVVASSDHGGTIRFIEAPNLGTDKAIRSGFGTVYDVDYNFLGIAQSEGNGKASIVVASSDSGGAVRVMEVDTSTLATTLADSVAPRFGFGTIAEIGLWGAYQTGTYILGVLCTDSGTAAAHIMDENLTDLSGFAVP